MRTAYLLIGAALLLTLAVGCTENAAPAVPDTAVEEIGASLDDVGSLDQDLADLDTLEQDLDALD